MPINYDSDNGSITTMGQYPLVTTMGQCLSTYGGGAMANNKGQPRRQWNDATCRQWAHNNDSMALTRRHGLQAQTIIQVVSTVVHTTPVNHSNTIPIDHDNWVTQATSTDDDTNMGDHDNK
ncbi:hypothetical protein EDB89DRAFT_1907313 [Lactarius sanguifluus]|nr:hypothetical protein EDB89DRAFT_1907313 [Lactarius sanguifluus]